MIEQHGNTLPEGNRILAAEKKACSSSDTPFFLGGSMKLLEGQFPMSLHVF